MKFEKFKRKAEIGIDKPMITITANNKISCNKSFVKNYITDEKYVVLYYSADEGVIGAKFVKEYEESSYLLVRRGTNIGIHAQAFFRYYDIVHKNTKRYQVSFDKESGIFHIDLKRDS